MGNRITKSTFELIHQLVRENPSMSNRKIATLVGLGPDAVGKWRARKDYPGDAAQTAEPAITIAEEHKLQRENKQLKQQVQHLLDESVRNDRLMSISSELAAHPIKLPKWAKKAYTGKSDIAVPCAFASDWHLDERVNLAQMGGVNEFNRKIAEVRAANFFDNTVRLAKRYISGIRYEGIYLFLGGDMFSGNIHEELKETNETTIIESIIHWVEPVAAGIRYLADEFGAVHIPCVVGNHGRLSHKPIAKNRVQDNFDYLFYNMLAMALKADDRITWDISQAADCRFTIHDTTFLLTHGDQFRGGTGIAGLLSPLMLGDARKRKRQNALHQSYDWMVYGHWHSLVLGVRGLLGNGSLKGYDEYAMVSNFDYEPPQQALWLVQPRRGVTMRWPIHVLGDTEKYL